MLGIIIDSNFREIFSETIPFQGYKSYNWIQVDITRKTLIYPTTYNIITFA